MDEEKKKRLEEALRELHEAVMDYWPMTKTWNATYYVGVNKLTVSNNLFKQASIYDAHDYCVTVRIKDAHG